MRIVLSWVFIAIGLCIHNVLEVGEHFFFQPLPEKPLHEGIPMAASIIYLTTLIIPMGIAYLFLYYKSKILVLSTMVYAILLTLLNVAHLVETLVESMDNFVQLALLLFVAIVNVVLVLQLIKFKKEA